MQKAVSLVLSNVKLIVVSLGYRRRGLMLTRDRVDCERDQQSHNDHHHRRA